MKFKWFKKKEEIPIHKCCYSKSLGHYYKLYRTEYVNRFDEVIVFDRRQCECGNYMDIPISKEEFKPTIARSSYDKEINDYINKLRKLGIKDEIELNLQTGLISDRGWMR